MHGTRQYALGGLLFAVTAFTAAQPPDELPTRDQRIAGHAGCFVLLDMDSGDVERINIDRCAERVPPCSTFKVFNALVALETGVAKGPDDLRRWDGTPQRFPEWEKDHTLGSAVKGSVLWYFQALAGEIGVERMQHWLDAVGYGNATINGAIDEFWLIEDALAISADEQVAFLARLYRDDLPFRQRSMRLVRDMLTQYDDDGVGFNGKTGTGELRDGTQVGWFVGHVQRGDRQWVFALRLRGVDVTGYRTARPAAIALLEERELLPHGVVK